MKENKEINQNFKIKIEKFIESQDEYWADVVDEMKSGKKKSHWIWFVFPQINGLSISEKGQFFSLNSIDDAKMYFDDKILRYRMLQILIIIKNQYVNDINELMGNEVDALKFAASMTLFEQAIPNEKIFSYMFEKFDIDRDEFTLEKVNPSAIEYFRKIKESQKNSIKKEIEEIEDIKVPVKEKCLIRLFKKFFKNK